MEHLNFKPETPFGIRLYPYFEQAYEAVTGQRAAGFSFTPGVTPFSTTSEGNSGLDDGR